MTDNGEVACGCPSRSTHLAGRLLDVFHDGDVVNVGAGLRAVRSAAVLAHRRDPSIRLIAGMQWVQFDADADTSLPEDVGASVVGAKAYGHYRHDQVMIARRYRPTVFFVGALEVDVNGAVNLFGIQDHDGWMLRGPGAIGTQSMTAWADRYIIVASHLRDSLFVQEASLVTIPGWTSGRGPARVVTPQAEFDFQGEGGTIRLVGVVPPLSPEQVLKTFPFVEAPRDVPAIEEPSKQDRLELESILRGRQ